MNAVTHSTPPRSPWAWAAYLGASWTWCIGMFLPVLLIRDYGPWAWVLFAVPNCVGAAAMGWVMRSAEQSRQYTARHAAACRCFGFVTIAFQLFFSIWMLPQLVGVAGYLGPLVLIQLTFTPVGKDRRVAIVGAALLVVSITLVLTAGLRGALITPASHTLALADAVGLGLVCLLGFLTCPYLDLTFHRARQSTGDADAKVAFGVGFCVCFASMIVLTFFYATNFFGLGGVAGALIATHLFLQMAYTVNLHALELVRGPAPADLSLNRDYAGLALAVAVVAGLSATFAATEHLTFHGFTIGEVAYRSFMACYGLLFPAYVLLAIGRGKVGLRNWLTVSAVGLPFFAITFLTGRMAWGAAGVSAVVAAAFVVRLLTPPVSIAPIE